MRNCTHCKGGGCRQCYGTGKNTRLTIEGDQCIECRGTGKCLYCGNPPQSELFVYDWLRRIRRLFGKED